VAFLDVALRRFACADAIQKIADVRLLRFEVRYLVGFDHPALRVESLPAAAVPAEQHEPLAAVNLDPRRIERIPIGK
jgi:hypothetical protein